MKSKNKEILDLPRKRIRYSKTMREENNKLSYNNMILELNKIKLKYRTIILIYIISFTLLATSAFLYVFINIIEEKTFTKELTLFFSAGMTMLIASVASLKYLESSNKKQRGIVDINVKSSKSPKIDDFNSEEIENYLINIHAESISRIKKELASLAKRGNFNLVLGMVTAFCGFSILAISLVFRSNHISMTDFLTSYFPRLSLVILVEIFAYFFLSLYRQNTEDIKYYQNELTNIEAKFFAFLISLRSTDANQNTLLIKEFLQTERNFILKKNQTTVAIEREKISSKLYIDKISGLLRRMEK